MDYSFYSEQSVSTFKGYTALKPMIYFVYFQINAYMEKFLKNYKHTHKSGMNSSKQITF